MNAIIRNRKYKFNKNEVKNKNEFEKTQQKLSINLSTIAGHQEDVECSDGHVQNPV